MSKELKQWAWLIRPSYLQVWGEQNPISLSTGCRYRGRANCLSPVCETSLLLLAVVFLLASPSLPFPLHSSVFKWVLLRWRERLLYAAWIGPMSFTKSFTSVTYPAWVALKQASSSTRQCVLGSSSIIPPFSFIPFPFCHSGPLLLAQTLPKLMCFCGPFLSAQKPHSLALSFHLLLSSGCSYNPLGRNGRDCGFEFFGSFTLLPGNLLPAHLMSVFHAIKWQSQRLAVCSAKEGRQHMNQHLCRISWERRYHTHLCGWHTVIACYLCCNTVCGSWLPKVIFISYCIGPSLKVCLLWLGVSADPQMIKAGNGMVLRG